MQLVVTCNAEGQFKAEIPQFALGVLGYGTVSGKTIDEVIKKWLEASVHYTETKTKTNKVILYEVEANAYIYRDDRCIARYEDRGSGFSHGISLNVVAVVCNEIQLTLPNGKVRYNYEEVEDHNLPNSMADMRHFQWGVGRGEEAKSKLPWTQEREDFFAKIGRAMEDVIMQLKQLDDPTRALEIADAGKLLPYKV